MVTRTHSRRYRAGAMRPLSFVLPALVLGSGCKAASAPAPAPVIGLEASASEEGVLQFRDGMTRPTPLAEGEIVFTPEAASAGVSGVAVVRCLITKEGSVKACRVMRSVPFMDDALVIALQRHRTTPVTLDGRPIDVDYNYTIRLKQPGDGKAPPPPPPNPVPNPGADAILGSLGPRLNDCYAAGLRQRTMAGQVVFIVTVEVNGNAGPVWHRRQDGNLSPEVLACASSVLASATFPPLRGGHPAALEVPLTLGGAPDAGPSIGH